MKNEPPISGGGVRETDLIKAIKEKELFSLFFEISGSSSSNSLNLS